MRLRVAALALLMFAAPAFATTDRVLDGKTITTFGGGTLTLPTSTDTLTGKATTDTFTNKSIDGSTNTLSNIPVNSATGTLSVAHGGTGDVTLTLNGVVFGNGTSAAGITAAGSQYQSFQAGASGVPTVDAVHLDQAAAITGTLPVANGGTGAATLTANNVLLGNGTSAVQFVAPGTSGNVLTSNGTTWSSSAPASAAPSITGTRASPTNITAGGGIAFSGSNYQNIAFIQGNGGAVTVTANPQIAAGTAVGQFLRVIGRSATNTVTLADGTGLSLNGTWVGGLDSILNLVWDGTNWTEMARR